MSSLQLSAQLSFWWIIIFLLISIGIAALTYLKKNPWEKFWTPILFGLRTVAVFLICLLLFKMSVKNISSTIIPAEIVINIDNSASLIFSDSENIKLLKDGLSELASKLEKANYKVSLNTFTGKINSLDELTFDFPTSNLDQLIKSAEQRYNQRNLVTQVLVTDGIVNMGSSPLYFPYQKPIYTVGYGDSIPKKDIEISRVTYNKISYLGNRFPLFVEIKNNGFENIDSKVIIRNAGNILSEQKINFKESPEVVIVEFNPQSTKAGIMSIDIEIETPEDDYIKENNYKKIFIDIIEGKQKVAILSPFPHPDLKALRTAIEDNSNYETSLFIDGLNQFKNEKYDLFILYQLPDDKSTFDAEIKKIIDNNQSILYVWGPNTSLRKLNALENFINIENKRGKNDLAYPLFNEGFSSFKFETNSINVFNKLNPLELPYADISFSPSADVMLWQRIGKVNTEAPMLILNNESGIKRAIMLGHNLWQWKLQEYAMNENHNAFNELWSKTTAYLASKEDKRRFKVYPTLFEFNDKNPIKFDTELYDDLYDQVYNYDVKLVIKPEQKDTTYNYQFTATLSNTAYNVGNLPSGAYKYTASTQYQSENYTVSGEFVVNELNIENLMLTANFNLLRAISSKNNGSFHHWTNTSSLAEELIDREFPDKIKSDFKTNELGSFWWYIILIILIFGTEWFLRKYLGEL